jgi:hypothetical protein
MQPFKTHITTEKNIHLEHIEDQVLNRGAYGATESLNFLFALRDMLAGHATAPINLTTKWDGAPAVVCGVNPENDQFFVGTKSVLNKTPKLNYTERDINVNHPNDELNQKLKACLRYLPKLGIKGILQGDLMFTKGDVKDQTIDGREYVTFTPNTLTYAFQKGTTLAERIKEAQLGIVFHTSYHGTKMDNLIASYNVDIGYLNHPKEVWYRDASYVDETGTVTFTQEELTYLNTLLNSAVKSFSAINDKVLNQIALNGIYRDNIKIFNNTKVRAGESILDTTLYTNQLIHWLETRMTAAIGEAKLPETKRKRTQERTNVLGFLRAHAPELRSIFDLQNQLVYAKMFILNKLHQVSNTHTFLRTETGYKATNPEGFVAVDHFGNAVKLVDRLSFSHANFTAAKDWSK